MNRNNFQELDKITQDTFGEPPKEIRNNIHKNVRFFHLFGDLIDLFFPKVINIFTSILGGSTDRRSEYKDFAKPPNLLNKNQTK